MTEKDKQGIPIRIIPETAAAGYLKRFGDQVTKKDAEDLQQIFYWFEQQGKESAKKDD